MLFFFEGKAFSIFPAPQQKKKIWPKHRFSQERIPLTLALAPRSFLHLMKLAGVASGERENEPYPRHGVSSTGGRGDLNRPNFDGPTRSYTV